jgi:hypothetical protein
MGMNLAVASEALTGLLIVAIAAGRRELVSVMPTPEHVAIYDLLLT